MEEQDSQLLPSIPRNPDIVHMAMEQYKGQPISNLELCKLGGFTDTELEHVKIFWNPIIEDTLIYLNDDIIKNWLTDSISKDAINDFNKKMIKKYELNIDYFEVTKDDPDVVNYYKINSYIFPNRKRYFKITSDCLNHLLMESSASTGKIIRNSFIKIKKMAFCMKDYIIQSTIQRIEAEKAHKIEKLKLKFYDVNFLDDEDRNVRLLDKNRKSLNLLNLKAGSFVYFIALDEYMDIIDECTGKPRKSRIFGFGFSDNIHDRLIDHDSNYPNYTLLHLFQITKGRDGENLVKTYLKNKNMWFERKRKNGKMDRELFITTPQTNIHTVISDVFKLCLELCPISMYEATIAKQEIDIKNKEEQINILEKERKSLQSTVTSLQNIRIKNKELRTKIKELELDNARREVVQTQLARPEQITLLENEIGNISSGIVEINKKIDVVQPQLDYYKKLYESQKERTMYYQSSNDSLHAQVRVLRIKVEELTKSNTELQSINTVTSQTNNKLIDVLKSFGTSQTNVNITNNTVSPQTVSEQTIENVTVSPNESSIKYYKMEVNGNLIQVRTSDHYVNGTELGRAGGKMAKAFIRNGSTQDFAVKISRTTGISIDKVMCVLDPKSTGTKYKSIWIHPMMAIKMAYWMSPDIGKHVETFLKNNGAVEKSFVFIC